MKVFFDTSAFVKRYVDEEGSEDVVRLCQDATSVGLSSICLPEMISTFCRLKREQRISIHQYQQLKGSIYSDIEDIMICQLTVEVLKTSVELLEKNTLRAIDALHIACASQWDAGLFVSSDQQQLAAAEAYGLSIETV